MKPIHQAAIVFFLALAVIGLSTAIAMLVSPDITRIYHDLTPMLNG